MRRASARIAAAMAGIVLMISGASLLWEAPASANTADAFIGCTTITVTFDHFPAGPPPNTFTVTVNGVAGSGDFLGTSDVYTTPRPAGHVSVIVEFTLSGSTTSVTEPEVTADDGNTSDGAKCPGDEGGFPPPTSTTTSSTTTTSTTSTTMGAGSGGSGGVGAGCPAGAICTTGPLTPGGAGGGPTTTAATSTSPGTTPTTVTGSPTTTTHGPTTTEEVSPVTFVPTTVPTVTSPATPVLAHTGASTGLPTLAGIFLIVFGGLILVGTQIRRA